MKRIAYLLILTLTMALGTSVSAAVTCNAITVTVIEQHGNIAFDPSTCSVSGQGSLTLAVGATGASSVQIHNSAVTAGSILTPAGRLWAGRSTTAEQVLASLNLPAVVTLNGAIDVHFFAFIGVPVIQPTAGPRGTLFTITDPTGRIESGSVALFYKLGQDPTTQGINAENVTISADGTTLMGNVPSLVIDGDNFVAVRPDRVAASYFDDLRFIIE